MADGTPELLNELNTLNADIRFARAFHLRGQLLIEADVLAEALDPAGFENACNCVASVTLEIAPRLAARFGGRLTIVNKTAQAEAPAPDSVPTGPAPLSLAIRPTMASRYAAGLR